MAIVSGVIEINQKADDATILNAVRQRLAHIEWIANYGGDCEGEVFDTWRGIQDLAQQGVLLMDVFLERHEELSKEHVELPHAEY